MECCLCSKEIVGIPVADLSNFWIFCRECYLQMGKGGMIIAYNNGRDYLIINTSEHSYSVDIILAKYIRAVQLELFPNHTERQKAPYQLELFPLFEFEEVV